MTQSTAIKGQKVKFATQLSSDVLAELRQMAHEEGRQIQSILDEALKECQATHACDDRSFFKYDGT